MESLKWTAFHTIKENIEDELGSLEHQWKEDTCWTAKKLYLASFSLVQVGILMLKHFMRP